MNEKKLNFETETIHCGSLENPYGALSVPIFQTSTFIVDNVEEASKRFRGEGEGFIYSRMGNPTRSILETKLSILEKGEDSIATSSGMGAITSSLWSFIQSGDHIISDKTLYGPTFDFLVNILSKFGIDVSIIDTSNLDEVKSSIKDNTKVIYLETPANPNLKIVDIEGIASLSHAINKNIIVMVDNTFATPYCQKPLNLGADVVIHSLTKYLNGHGDVIGGSITASAVLIKKIKNSGIKMTGSILGPTESFYVIRGLKTFAIRMKKHCENAILVAEFLNSHEKIKTVYFPGLENHPNHEIAKKQMNYFGAVIAFELKGGFESGKKLLSNLDLCLLGVSLGDAETLIQHPASMTHSGYSQEEKIKAGITDGLIRISIGIENAEDIINDLKNGLNQL